MLALYTLAAEEVARLSALAAAAAEKQAGGQDGSDGEGDGL